jgi:hypothetical protein
MRQQQLGSSGDGTMTGPRHVLAAPALLCLLLLTACGVSHGLTLGRPDTRTTIGLAPKEREQLRQGMRIYLESVEAIVDGVHRNNLRAVAGSAKRSGMSMLEDISLGEAVKLPPEFIILSIDTHQRFDALSRLAEAGESKSGIMDQLSGILANCTSCHSTYRVAP